MNHHPETIGIDVGGANLKYAGTTAPDGGADIKPAVSQWSARHRCFPIWRRPDGLAAALVEDLRQLGAAIPTKLAVTMTGELADCFADRSIGVDHIVDHVQRAASELGITDVAYYGVDGKFHAARDAVTIPDTIAAANWHALASWIAREFCDSGLLIDIGSTTTDLIPIADGRVATDAVTDFDRLTRSQLVYIGGRRTPVCAITDTLLHDGRPVPVMNEVFATIDDARIVLALQPEIANDSDTADNQPRTIPHAANRLARMIGLDRRSVTPGQAVELARQIVSTAKSKIAAAITPPPSGDYVISGHCDDMIELPPETNADASVKHLSNLLGPDLSRSAPAYAVARLRRTR